MKRIGFLLMFFLLCGAAYADNGRTAAAPSDEQPPTLRITQFKDGRDYFSYQEALPQPARSDKKILIQFFFDYDCRVCSLAQDILTLYSQINADKVILLESPVATEKANAGATVFFTLQALRAGSVSDLLLFESSEKPRFIELSQFSALISWLQAQNVDTEAFKKLYASAEIRAKVRDAIKMTEDYGVFTYPYVIVGGKYVLTASTLYNDDYSFAVLDFLMTKLTQGK
ncbi:thiol:disulfide interchange protein DsbA/DsbL [Necropsobacter massiliensis]|uniref:thiol:disulfide interchange protein DsbA/DsbL n=1 Tax=Necropsobacter massiliensis TaxID=1400001 RepID=UPI000595CD26